MTGCCLIASTGSVSGFELAQFQAVTGLPSWWCGLAWVGDVARFAGVGSVSAAAAMLITTR